MSVSLRHPVRHMHPRQRVALQGVPLRDVSVVTSRAHFLQNTGGGILSGCMFTAAQEYRRWGADHLRVISRRDNLEAMRSCGCPACNRDVVRLEVK